MTLLYPRQPDANDFLFGIRLIFSSAMVIFVVLGFVAIRRGDVLRHRAWMMRAYAIGLGVGTQALFLMGAEIVAGPLGGVTKVLLMAAAWAANLALAEFHVHRPTSLPAGRPTSAASTLDGKERLAQPEQASSAVAATPDPKHAERNFP